MTTTDTRDAEVADYLDGVRTSLSDLPSAQLDALLEDLLEHLTEAAATDPRPLALRLGSPEAFAAETRAAAGLPPAVAAPPRGVGSRSGPTMDHVRALADRADEVFGQFIGYDRATAFIVLLRPAWWLVRGFIVALWLLYLSGGVAYVEAPGELLQVVVPAVLVAGPIISVRLGRSTQRSGPATRLIMGMVSVTTGIIAVIMFLQLADRL